MQLTWNSLTGQSLRLDEPKTTAGKLLAGVLLVAGLLLLVPLALLFGVFFYVTAILQGVRLLLRPAAQTKPPDPLPRPHFSDALAEDLARGHEVRKANHPPA